MKNGSLFTVLQFRDVRLLLFGNFISSIGSYMQIVGVGWHIYQLTHSAFFLGLLGLVGFFPTLLTFLPAGVLVDKHHKKDLLLVTELLLGIIALILFLTTHLQIINVWIIFLSLFMSSLVSSIEIPSRNATIPLIVPEEHLNQALNLHTLSRQVGAVAGPALAGFCIAFYGVQSVYFLNAISFLFYFAMISFIHVPRVTAAIDISKVAIIEGLQFIKNNSLIAVTMLLDFFATFFAGAMVLLPVFAKDVYHVNVQQLGLLYAAPSIGAMLAGTYLSVKPNMSHQGKILLGAIGIYAIGTIGFGLSSLFPLGFLFLAITGAGDMVSTVIRNIIRQRLTPPTLRGRVLSVIMIFFMGGPYLGDAEAGFVAGIFGAPLSVAMGGILTLILTLGIAWKIPALRRYNDHNSVKLPK